MKANLISIIVPTFNRAHTLSSCIGSVAKQKCENWELIVVDDGSVDSTLEVIRPFLNDQKIKYVYQENMGVSAARNLGALTAKGDYLIFLDSDDIIFSNLISTLNENSYHLYDIICWQINKISMTGEKLWKPKKLEPIYNGIKASFLAGSICYNKNVFNIVGGYDTNLRFGENYELGLRISQVKDLKIKIIDRPLSQYNLQQSRSSNSDLNKLKSYHYLYDKHKELYQADFRSHSTINYLLGHIYEKMGQFEKAKIFYLKSGKINILNYKAHLKSLYFKFLK